MYGLVYTLDLIVLHWLVPLFDYFFDGLRLSFLLILTNLLQNWMMECLLVIRESLDIQKAVTFSQNAKLQN